MDKIMFKSLIFTKNKFLWIKFGSEAEAWMGEQELYMMSDVGGRAPLLPEGEESEIQMKE